IINFDNTPSDAEIESPAQVFAAVDAYNSIEIWGLHMTDLPHWTQTPPNGVTRKQHSGVMNVVFADGHVKAVRQSCLGNWERSRGAGGRGAPSRSPSCSCFS